MRTLKDNQLNMFKQIVRFGYHSYWRIGIQDVSFYLTVCVTYVQILLLNSILVDTITRSFIKIMLGCSHGIIYLIVIWILFMDQYQDIDIF